MRLIVDGTIGGVYHLGHQQFERLELRDGFITCRFPNPLGSPLEDIQINVRILDVDTIASLSQRLQIVEQICSHVPNNPYIQR